ncbi:hypothetical protein ACFQE2_16225 [Methylophaga thalassica]|uniref:hypothetical protein n=1 Tax=Methylophaga thalassica TaxID=40223 RepID=UPI00361AAA94
MILKTELKDEKEIERFERALTSSRFGSRSAFLQHIISVYLLRSEEKENLNSLMSALKMMMILKSRRRQFMSQIF